MKICFWWLFLAATVVLPENGLCQQTSFIWEPTLSFSWEQSDRLVFNSKTSLFLSVPDLNNESAVDYGESALSFAYGVSERSKIGGGYLFRYSDPMTGDPCHEHRPDGAVRSRELLWR